MDQANQGLTSLRPAAKSLMFQLPHFVFLAISVALVVALFAKIIVRHSFDINEGWNAYWAAAALGGHELYPDLASLKLDNYPPLWFYGLTGDNVQAGRILASAALLLIAAVVALIVLEITKQASRRWFSAAARPRPGSTGSRCIVRVNGWLRRRRR